MLRWREGALDYASDLDVCCVPTGARATLSPVRIKVINSSLNAAERFLAASRARDVEAAASELAADVVMRNPATDDLTIGRDAVAASLRAVEAACDEFRHTHLLTETSVDGKPLIGLVFEARIGESTLYGVDVVELDDDDHIIGFTVAARPIAGLMALGARMAAQGSPGAQGTRK